MRLLVTAGPTREYLDAVRFLSNASTGRMGFAVARAAAAAGHRVALVAGPVGLSTPPGVDRVDVVSALEMREAVLRRFDACDAVVKAAAVCDYRPAEILPGKMKKDDTPRTLALVPNPDILAELGRRKRRQVLIGFALEATLDRSEAHRKLVGKNLDAIVLNAASAMGAERTTVEILTRDGRIERLADRGKDEVARRIVVLAEELVAGGGEAPR